MAVENPVLQRAIDHFQALEMLQIEVEEWGEPGAPLTIFARPLTMGEKNILARSGRVSDLGVLVDVIIMKSEDADGNKLFTKQDKPHFMRTVDPDVISRVATEILRTEDEDEQLGNSEAIGNGSS